MLHFTGLDQNPVNAISGPLGAGPRVRQPKRWSRLGVAWLLGEADLLPLNSGVPEGGDDDELVALPLAGLGELEVERLSGWRNHFAVGQRHLSRERPGGVGDDGDPVVASELDRVRVCTRTSGNIWTSCCIAAPWAFRP